MCMSYGEKLNPIDDAERNIAPSKTITPDSLSRLSQELYEGNSVYGEAAASFLDWIDPPMAEVWHEDNAYWLTKYAGVYTNPIPLILDGCRAEKNTLAAIAAAMLYKHRPMPFSLEPTFPVDTDNDQLINRFYMQTGQNTAKHLAEYMLVMKYNEHKLHGTLGGMFNVLKVISDVTDRSQVPVPIPESTIPAEALMSLIRSGFRSRFNAKVTQLLLGQIWTGQPSKYGEIVVQGDIRLSKKHPMISWQEIALSSLKRLAQSYNPEGYMRQLLLEISRGQTLEDDV